MANLNQQNGRTGWDVLIEYKWVALVGLVILFGCGIYCYFSGGKVQVGAVLFESKESKTIDTLVIRDTVFIKIGSKQPGEDPVKLPSKRTTNIVARDDNSGIQGGENNRVDNRLTVIHGDNNGVAGDYKVSINEPRRLRKEESDQLLADILRYEDSTGKRVEKYQLSRIVPVTPPPSFLRDIKEFFSKRGLPSYDGMGLTAEKDFDGFKYRIRHNTIYITFGFF